MVTPLLKSGTATFEQHCTNRNTVAFRYGILVENQREYRAFQTRTKGAAIYLPHRVAAVNADEYRALESKARTLDLSRSTEGTIYTFHTCRQHTSGRVGVDHSTN